MIRGVCGEFSEDSDELRGYMEFVLNFCGGPEFATMYDQTTKSFTDYQRVMSIFLGIYSKLKPVTEELRIPCNAAPLEVLCITALKKIIDIASKRRNVMAAAIEIRAPGDNIAKIKEQIIELFESNDIKKEEWTNATKLYDKDRWIKNVKKRINTIEAKISVIRHAITILIMDINMRLSLYNASVGGTNKPELRAKIKSNLAQIQDTKTHIDFMNTVCEGLNGTLSESDRRTTSSSG